MNDSDQLRESCQHLLDQSAALRERSTCIQANCAESSARLKRLDRRYRAAREEAQHLRQCIPTRRLSNV